MIRRQMKLFALARTILAAACAIVMISASASAQQADIVFTDAKVYTLNPDQEWAEAVGIKGNKIVYVGSDEGAASWIGEGTEVIDLSGKMIVPGFVSGHEHLIASSWTQLGVQLGSAQSKQDDIDLVKAYAEANPDERTLQTTKPTDAALVTAIRHDKADQS